MFMPANVIIRKQKFRIRAPDENTALRLRKEMNEGLQFEYISLLERVFQQNAPGDIYLHLDKLSVELGVISQQEFESRFLQLLETKLEKAAAEKIQEQMSFVYKETPGSFSNEVQQEKDFTGGGGAYSEKEQQWLALIYFLEKGIYPWWFRSTQAVTPQQILSSFENEEMERLAMTLIDFNNKNKETGSRVVQRTVTHLPADKKEALTRKLLFLKNDPGLTTNAEALLQYQQVLEKIFNLPLTEFYIYFIKTVLESSGAERSFIKTFITTLMQAKDITGGETGKVMAGIKEYLAKEIYQPPDEITGEQNTTAESLSGFNRQAEQKNKMATEKTPGTKTKETTSRQEEGMYISNAGLVLLHPFLEALFTECKLLDEKKQFISEAEAIQATALLWYLQSGEDELKEWEAAFCKILCGLEVETHIPENVTLSMPEKKECDELLKTVLAYWTALRTEDINLLRGSFLNREGKIVWKDDHWLLQVERTGIDILLDKLPWGYGTIKLPWLQHLIYVEW